MSQGPDLGSSTRLLVVAPHPDDETLATGGLIQEALSAGAHLRVVILTDGDNNPWPQRWIEKRWRIDAEARVRWGARRRGEATTALSRLGVAAHDIRHFGWPDQGLTALLMRDSQCEDRLVAEILDFAPDLIAAPSLADRHPDHNAARAMLELALARTPQASCRRLGFVVHGTMIGRECLALATNEEQVRIKQQALQAHASQLVLSRKRMTRICGRIEQFESSGAQSAPAATAHQGDWQIPYRHSGLRLHRRALYLIAEVGGQMIRTRLPLPRSLARAVTHTVPGDWGPLTVQLHAAVDGLRINLDSESVVHQAFAKVQRLGPRILIYDDAGWMRK